MLKFLVLQMLTIKWKFFFTMVVGDFVFILFVFTDMYVFNIHWKFHKDNLQTLN